MKGTYRSLSSFNDHIDFFSNDYLGLSTVEIESASKQFGGTGSRLISGNSDLKMSSESKIAEFFKGEKALMFNSGFDANLGILSCLPQKGDTIIYDELIHASIRDGVRLSFAQSLSFKHNDIIDLEKKIKRATGTIYVVIEALYSMDGDLGLLKEINSLCNEFGANLIVDEAHSSGVYGEHGKGLVFEYGLTESVFARIITFGKAYGSHGACILGSELLIEYLINFARSFIYTTALPDNVFERNSQIISSHQIPNKITALKERIRHFRQAFDVNYSDENSPIQIVYFKNQEDVISKSKEMQNAKIAIKAILAPTVPFGKERIRVCIHSFNTIAEIDYLISFLKRD